jgi:RNA polymerase sigma factor (sigma-70 family)
MGSGMSKNQLALKNYDVNFNKNENDLWLDIIDGNEHALADLFRLYYSRLYNYGMKIVTNQEFIKDCIQELFLTLWDSKNSINDAYSVKSYLFSSLRRTIFRKLKKNRATYERNKKYVENHFTEPLNVEQLIVHFEVEQESKKQLRKAIDHLGGRQKEAIYLKYYDGLSNAEIADVMGINRQSVYNHVSGAIQRLQQFIH